MQNFIEVKNGNPGFQGAWLKPENLGLTEALRSRRFDEAQGTAVVLQGKDKFRVDTFLVIVNQLQTALRCRIDAYADVRKVFQVITEFNELGNGEIRELALCTAETYHTDLQSRTFPDEMIQFVHFAKSRGCSSPSDLASLIHSEDLYCTFPNYLHCITHVHVFDGYQLFWRTFVQSNGISEEQSA